MGHVRGPQGPVDPHGPLGVSNCAHGPTEAALGGPIQAMPSTSTAASLLALYKASRFTGGSNVYRFVDAAPF